MPAVFSTFRPAKRLRKKTDHQTYSLDVPLGHEKPDAVREVYLVTLSHPKRSVSQDGVILKPPKTYTREQIRDAILHCCRNPQHDPAYLRGHPDFVPAEIVVEKLVVFREYHAADQNEAPEIHYHIAIKLVIARRYMPLKRALLHIYGLAAHFGCTHNMYWSAVSYGVHATTKKSRSALDPSPVSWARDGPHPRLLDEANEPITASALESRREKHTQAAGEEGKGEPRVSDIDMWPVIVRSGIKPDPDNPYTTEKLMAYVKKNCSHATVAWLYKNEEKIPKMIHNAWRWENVEQFLETAARPRQEIFAEAMEKPCVCGGRWLQAVKESLQLNRIDVPRLCHLVKRAIEEGRSEVLPVPTLVGREGGEGKSFFFAPLRPMFGEENVQGRPAGGGFSLLGLDRAKVCLLDEWQFGAESLELPVQFLWLEGKPVPIRKPQNSGGDIGHGTYRGSAPIFVTTDEPSVRNLSYLSHSQARMLLRRLEIFEYTVPLPKPPLPLIKPCPRCFARHVTEQSAIYDATILGNGRFIFV